MSARQNVGCVALILQAGSVIGDGAVLSTMRDRGSAPTGQAIVLPAAATAPSTTGIAPTTATANASRSTLERSPSPTTRSALIDERQVDVPVVAPHGIAGSEPVDVLFLDDARNPISLIIHVDSAVEPLDLQVVRIIGTGDVGSAIDQALSAQGRVDVPGLSFNTAEARMLPASDAALDAAPRC